MTNDKNNKNDTLSDKLEKGIENVTKKIDLINANIEDQYKKDIDVIASSYSKDTSQKISLIEKKENLTFIAGNLKAKLDDRGKNLILKLELYFQNTAEKIILKSTENSVNSDILSMRSLDELKNGNEILFPVEYPEVE